MAAYRVGYQCPSCSKTHLTGHVITSPEPNLAGQPLIEAYYGDASRSEVVAILGEVIRCPTSQKIVTPELEQFFLEEAR